MGVWGNMGTRTVKVVKSWKETLEAVTTFISGVGFPICAVYSLVRLEKRSVRTRQY